MRFGSTATKASGYPSLGIRFQRRPPANLGEFRCGVLGAGMRSRCFLVVELQQQSPPHRQRTLAAVVLHSFEATCRYDDTLNPLLTMMIIDFAIETITIISVIVH